MSGAGARVRRRPQSWPVPCVARPGGGAGPDVVAPEPSVARRAGGVAAGLIGPARARRAVLAVRAARSGSSFGFFASVESLFFASVDC